MTGRGRVVVAAVLVIVSCSSGPSTPAPKPASANRAACTSWKKFLDHLASTPNIVALSRSELSAASTRRETLERVVAATTTGSLHDDLLLDADIRSALRKAMVAEWGDANGERLNETAAAGGYAYIRDYLMRDRLAVGRRRIARGDAIRLYSAVRRRMAVLCGTARPLRLSTLAISGPLPADVVGVQLGEGHLVRIGRRDGRLVPRPVPEGWKATGQTEALAGGRRLAFVGTNDPKGRVDVLVGAVLDLGSARPVTAATLNAPCFDWSPSEDRMAVSVGFGRPDQRMQVIDAGGAIADVPVQGVDPVDLDCPVFLDSSNLIAGIGDPDRADLGISRVAVSGGIPQRVVLLRGCNALLPRVVTGSSRLYFLASCFDDARSGLYLANVDGSDPRQIVAGTIGVFDVTRDGRWIVFAYVDPTGDGQTQLVALNVQKGVYVRVTAPGYSWPTWLE